MGPASQIEPARVELAGPDRGQQAGRARPWPRPADVWCALSLVLSGVAFPLVVAAGLHVLGVPRNDDFAYRATVLQWEQRGDLHIVPWGAMTLVGQLGWALPFVALLGPDQSAPVLAVAPLTALGLCFAYYLARATLRRPLALGCTLMVLAAPGFLMGAATFMTDAPGWAAQVVSLGLGWAALNQGGPKAKLCLAGSVAVGIFAFAIRDFGLAAPVSVLACAWLSDGLDRLWALAGAVVTGVSCAVIYVLTRHLGVPATPLAWPASHQLFVLGAECFTLAFFLLPALVVAGARLWRSFQWPAALAGSATIVAGLKIESVFKDIFLGNYFDQRGALPIELGPGRPELFPPAVWDMFNVVALAAGALLAAVTVTVVLALPHRWPRGNDQTSLLAIFSVLAALPVAGYCLLVRVGSFDRYIYPLVLPLAILMVRPWGVLGKVAHSLPRRRARARPAAAGAGAAWLAVLLVVGTATMFNSDAYDKALWAAGEQAVNLGAPAKAVFDGFTWEGAYQGMHLQARYCAQISNIALKHSILFQPFHLEATVHWEDLGFAVPERLLVYRMEAPGCPKP